MCGISGIIQFDNKVIDVKQLQKMTDIIAHRGPDGEGQWISKNGNVALGHRRLSIIDLSHEANQPMHYLQDRYTIVFNGEIYNYIELKETLLKQGYQFKTKSDTEVLMALYDKHKEQCLQLLDGMFSFVIFDTKENIVFCARDRFGEKPFFYSYKKGAYFYFGSEMKCLWAGGIKKEPNNRMLFNYLSFGYHDNPADNSETFFQDCTRLPHSNYMVIDLNTNTLEIKKYFNINPNNVNNSITTKEASEKFIELFNQSIFRRLRSDVPVGSSLSGGLDSSLVVCTINDLKKGTNQIQKTFSAVFPGFAKDESKFIEYVLNKTNVEPHFVTPSDEDFLTDIEKLSWHQEEPYGSASIYIQYKVMELARNNNVTVLIDGQGADEILAGYHHYYLSFFNELKKNNKKDYDFQKQHYLNLHSNNTINSYQKKSIGNKIRNISPEIVKPLKKLKVAFNQLVNPILNRDFYEAYKNQIFTTSGFEFSNLNNALYNSTLESGQLQQLLRFADRNSMAHSLEVRLPFLNHELVEFLFSLPATMKMNLGWTKWIMRETFKTLPEEISWRKDKIGFEAPQKNWMQSPKIQNKIGDNFATLANKGILNKNYKKQINEIAQWQILSIN
jgi:asparagine synthase (glutamine-hydrolysing)